MAHDEIAAELGISRQNVQRLEGRALAKCRAWMSDHSLAMADLMPGTAPSMDDEFAALADDADRD
jgi:hypothetical protein